MHSVSKIKEQFGLSVKPEALYWPLLDEEPVRQVDLQVVGAAAAALGVALDDLFTVETAPDGVRAEANKPVLGARDGRRLAQLLDAATSAPSIVWRVDCRTMA